MLPSQSLARLSSQVGLVIGVYSGLAAVIGVSLPMPKMLFAHEVKAEKNAKEAAENESREPGE